MRNPVQMETVGYLGTKEGATDSIWGGHSSWTGWVTFLQDRRTAQGPCSGVRTVLWRWVIEEDRSAGRGLDRHTEGAELHVVDSGEEGAYMTFS